MKVQGEIVQVIAPEEVQNYLLPKLPDRNLFFHQVSYKDFPHSALGELYCFLTKRKLIDTFITVVSSKKLGNKGDVVDFEVEEALVPSGVFKLKEARQ